MDLTELELFKIFLEIDLNGLHIDLHNDFTCISFDYSNDDLTLSFQSDTGGKNVMLRFEHINILKLQLPLNSEGLTLDNFHRGRYEFEGKLYDDYFGKKCFYVEFYEGGSMDLLCKNASLQIQ